jgi:hypothetical protein
VCPAALITAEIRHTPFSGLSAVMGHFRPGLFAGIFSHFFCFLKKYSLQLPAMF